MIPGTDRAAVMVVRVWVEGSEGSFRARLTQTLDLTAREQTSRVAATTEEVLSIVRQWLTEFESKPGSAGTGSGAP